MELKSQDAVYRKLRTMANGKPFSVSRTMSSEGGYWFIHLGGSCVMGDTPQECFDRLKTAIEEGKPK